MKHAWRQATTTTRVVSPARSVTVVPVANENGLRNLAWIEGNRRKVADLSGGGMAIAMRSRNGVADTSRNATPAQKMMPSATGHGTPPLMITV